MHAIDSEDNESSEKYHINVADGSQRKYHAESCKTWTRILYKLEVTSF